MVCGGQVAGGGAWRWFTGLSEPSYNGWRAGGGWRAVAGGGGRWGGMIQIEAHRATFVEVEGKMNVRIFRLWFKDESMTIRPARVGDIVVIIGLAERIWRVAYAGMISDEQIDFMLGWMYSPREIEDQMSRGVRWGMGEIDGGAVGYFSFEKEADGRVKISKVYLLESAQRRGLGRAMLEFIGGEALAMGTTTLWLQVNKRNTVAMGAYRKAGFAVTGEGIFSIGGGYVMDDYLMSKEIGEIGEIEVGKRG